MVKIKGRVRKVGNTYVINISKGLIDSGLIRERELIELELSDSEELRRLVEKRSPQLKNRSAASAEEDEEENAGGGI